jgi:flagellar biosynthesis protein FliR
MPFETIYGALMGSLRALGLVAILPMPGSRPMPRTVRIGLAVLLAALLAGSAPVGELPTTHGQLLTSAVHELLVGLAMGFVGRTVFAVAELAGRLISNEVGVVASPGIDAPRPDQEPLPTFIAAFAGVMFFALGAHELVLAAFARSFDLAPAGAAAFSPVAGGTMVRATSQLIELGLRIAAPFIALNFVVTLGFAILGRAAPKMNVFVVSLSMRAVVGLTLMAGAGTLLARYFAGAFERLPWMILDLVART